MKRRRAASFVAASVALAVVATSAAAEPRALLELFTSQGCSSCPAADRLAGELAKDPSLVVVSIPIDYWDYLGWKDTLAMPQHSARQRGYAHQRGDRQVYTPQMVVNGSVHVLGSDKAAIERAILQSRHDGVMAVPVTAAVEGGKLKVELAGVEGVNAAEVWLCAVRRAVPVTVERGENRGHTITYHNVVRHWTRLGEWDGKAARFSVPLSEVTSYGADEAVVIVQPGSTDRPGPVYGAALATLQ